MTQIKTVIMSGLISVVACAGALADPEGQPSISSAYQRAATTTGAQYVEARGQLLNMDKSDVRTFLESKHHAATDPLQVLLIEALLARLRDAKRLDDALDEAIRCAGEDRAHMMRDLPPPGAGPTAPRPNEGGWLLAQRLGDEAVPLATELLCKGLTTDWEGWKRQVVVWSLRWGGRRDTHTIDATQTRLIREPQAAWVLLGVAERDADDACAQLAADALRNFASEDVLAAVRSAEERVASDRRKAVLAEAARHVAADLRILQAVAQHDGPPVTTTFVHRFEADAGRSLSTTERAELQRVADIASSATESLARRTEAVVILGEWVGHRECIDPLRAILQDRDHPEGLRAAAMAALAEIPDKGTIPVLIDAAGDSRNPVRLRLKAGAELSRATGERPAEPGRPMNAVERANANAEWWKRWRQEDGAKLVPARPWTRTPKWTTQPASATRPARASGPHGELP